MTAKTIDPSELDYFGVTGIDDRGTAAACEFRATYAGRIYVAYGSYESLDVYSVGHGPTQADVDMIAALLDDGFEPASGVQLK
jgi:hypothetical protein